MGLVTLNFDLLTLKLVYRSHVCWAISLPMLVFLALLVLEDMTRDRQTDRLTDRHPHRFMIWPHVVGHIIIRCIICYKLNACMLSTYILSSVEREVRTGNSRPLMVCSERIQFIIQTAMFAGMSILFHIFTIMLFLYVSLTLVHRVKTCM